MPLNEPLTLGDDDPLHSVNANSKNVIDWDVRKLLRQYSLVERYKRVDNATIHVHGVHKFFAAVELRFNFCAVLESLNQFIVDDGGADMFSLVSLRQNDMEMSMFVNIGEILQPSQLRRTILLRYTAAVPQ